MLTKDRKQKLKVAVIGTNGLPAKYGGFETLTQHLVDNLDDEFEFDVYCSQANTSFSDADNSAVRLSVLPLKANGWQSIPYDILSMVLATLRRERILLLGSSGGILVPVLRLLGKRVVVNVGGVDWKREKWNVLTKVIIQCMEYLAVKFSSVCIVDNKFIGDLYKERYNKKARFIPYGGDHIIKLASSDVLEEYDWVHRPFALSVSRAQKDNNIHLLLEAWRKMGAAAPLPLVIISNWDSSDYGKDLLSKFSGVDNILMLSAIYDQLVLDSIRSRAQIYLHTHSACGTAPSLVEAMSHGLAVIAFDACANRYTTEDSAWYFSTEEDICRLIMGLHEKDLEENQKSMSEIAKEKYVWERCCGFYRDALRG